MDMAKQPWIKGFTTNPSLLKKAGFATTKPMHATLLPPCRPAYFLRGFLRRNP